MTDQTHPPGPEPTPAYVPAPPAGAAVAIGFGVIFAVDSVDPARSSETGLADGNCGMEPTRSIFLGDRCAFGGLPMSRDTEISVTGTVTVVGEGDAECGASMVDPELVLSSVSSGVAQIVEVG